MSILLYLHGFNSFPQSRKANIIRAWLLQNRPDIEFIAPQLPHRPADVMVALKRIISLNSNAKLGVIGASLGGFYATWLSQYFSIPAIVMNPLTHPAKFLLPSIGKCYETSAGECITLNSQHLEDFRVMQLTRIISPDLLWLLVQKGDNVLPAHHAIEYYSGCRQTIEKKGNHSFVGIKKHLPEFINFLRL